MTVQGSCQVIRLARLVKKIPPYNRLYLLFTSANANCSCCVLRKFHLGFQRPTCRKQTKTNVLEGKRRDQIFKDITRPGAFWFCNVWPGPDRAPTRGTRC